MGSGTAVALETADAVLLGERLSGVVDLIALSRATLSNVRQNVAIAVGLKLLFLATTLVGITGLWMAILADSGATVLVTINALRLLRWRGSVWERPHERTPNPDGAAGRSQPSVVTVPAHGSSRASAFPGRR